MAKNKENEFFNKLAKDLGGELLENIESSSCIDTNILGLNYIISNKFIGGGVPEGGILEIYGPSATGKSLFGMGMLKGTQDRDGIAAYIDAERGINKEFAKKATKIDPKRLFVFYPDTMDDAFNKIHNIIRTIRENKDYDKKPLCIVYDSIAVSPSEEEFNETKIDMESASAAQKKAAGIRSKEMVGVRAKTAARELRKLMPVVAENNATVIIINQLRSKIGVLYGPDKTTAGGGESLIYYASTRLSITSSKKIKDENNAVIGCWTNFQTVKSRFTAPFQKVENASLMYEDGIDPFGGLLTLMLQAKRIKMVGKGRYLVLPEYSGGEEVIFSANKEQNMIPLDILLKCPKILDADKPEQVKKYIDLYGSAIGKAFKEDYQAESIDEEEDLE